jgi:hypothetical protein
MILYIYILYIYYIYIIILCDIPLLRLFCAGLSPPFARDGIANVSKGVPGEPPGCLSRLKKIVLAGLHQLCCGRPHVFDPGIDVGKGLVSVIIQIRNKSQTLRDCFICFLGLWVPADLSKYHEIPLIFLRNWNQSHGRLVQVESHSKNQTILVFIQEEIPKIEWSAKNSCGA